MSREQMWREVREYQSHFNPIDAAAAAACGCANCRSKVVSYHGFMRGDSYRAFIECQNCGACEEF